MFRPLALVTLILGVVAPPSNAQITLTIDPVAEEMALTGFDQGFTDFFRGGQGFLAWDNFEDFGDNADFFDFEEGVDFTLEPSLFEDATLTLIVEDSGRIILEATLDDTDELVDFEGLGNRASYGFLTQESKDILANADGTILFLDSGSGFQDVTIVVSTAPPPPAAYRAEITLEAETSARMGGDTAFSIFAFPFLTVDDEPNAPRGFNDPTDAFVTLTTPNGRSSAFVNEPTGLGGQSQLYVDQGELQTELNGTWTATVQEPSGQIFEYEIEVVFAYPFAQLPRITSSSIVEGAPYAPPFDFQFTGGDAQQIGPGASVQGSVRVGDTTTTFTTLAPDAGSYNPAFTPDGTEPGFLVSLRTIQEASDTRSASVVSVTALTPGAPPFIIDSLETEYEASLRANLLPAPASLCTADFDGDNDVDFGDFGFFVSAFDSVTGDANYQAAADFDNDGDVDFGDFGAFVQQFDNGPAECLP